MSEDQLRAEMQTFSYAELVEVAVFLVGEIQKGSEAMKKSTECILELRGDFIRANLESLMRKN